MLRVTCRHSPRARWFTECHPAAPRPRSKSLWLRVRAGLPRSHGGCLERMRRARSTDGWVGTRHPAGGRSVRECRSPAVTANALGSVANHARASSGPIPAVPHTRPTLSHFLPLLQKGQYTISQPLVIINPDTFHHPPPRLRATTGPVHSSLTSDPPHAKLSLPPFLRWGGGFLRGHARPRPPGQGPRLPTPGHAGAPHLEGSCTQK